MIIALALVGVVIWIVTYSFSLAVSSFFGKEGLIIVIFGMTLFFLIKDILKKIRKKKNE